MLPFKLVIPSLPRGSGRSRPRFPARGLTLTCTRPAPFRFRDGGRNLAIELKDVGWGGVRFVSAEPLPVPCSVDLQIRDEATGATVNTRGETKWSQTRRENGRDLHVAGAKFEMVLTPPAEAAWYFEGRVALQPKPWATRSAKPASEPRAAFRFPIPGCDVVLERDFRFRGSSKAGNLAVRLLDLSRSGAKVVCKDPVVRGEIMRLTVDIRTFQDIFTSEAETVWVRHPSVAGAREWRVGILFRELSLAQQRQIGTIERWFREAPRI